jgi:hypothetical protein
MDDHITSGFLKCLRLASGFSHPRRTLTKERSAERHHEAGRGASEIETVEDDAPATPDGSSSRVPMIPPVLLSSSHSQVFLQLH